MEPPPPPFLHGNNNRYAPIHHRFSGDRNFYHHTQPHPHHNLQPPPAPPPNPTPYHHHSQFPFPNSHPIEEDPRRHAFDVDRPARVVDRLIFEHHRHNHLPFPEEHPRLRGPEFNTSDAWDLHRVPPDNRPPPPPHPPAAFPVAWENEPHHPPFSHPMSPYDGNFVDQNRFGDDPEAAVGFREYSGKELIWDQINHRGNGSGNGHGDYYRHHVAFEPTMSSRDFESVTTSHHGSRHNLEFNNGRSWNSGGGADLDANRRWKSSRPHSKDVGSYAHHHSGTERENTEIVRDENGRILPEKHYTYTSKMGRFKNRITVEGNQEIIHTPKKKIQKPSALVRVQLANPSLRKRRDEHFGPSTYFDESNSGSFRGKGPLVFSDYRTEEDREGSPVELDVSFKSNTLVAKAILTPPSSVVSSEGTGTPGAKKMKSVLTLVSGLSSSRVPELREGSVNGDISTHGADASSSSDKAPILSKEKVKNSGIGTVDNVGVQPCPNEVTFSLQNSATNGTDEAVSTRNSINVGSAGTCTPNSKKKKAWSSDSRLSNSRASDKGPGNADSSTCGVDAIISSNKVPRESKDKVQVSGTEKKENVGSQACPNRVILSLEKEGSSRDTVSVVDRVNTVSDRTCMPKTKKKRRKILSSVSDLSNSRPSEVHEEPVNVDWSTCGAGAALSSDKGPTAPEEKVRISGLRATEDVGKHSFPNQDTGLSVTVNSVAEGPQKSMVSMSCVNVIYDKNSAPKHKKKKKVLSSVSSASSLQTSGAPEGPKNIDGSPQGTSSTLGSDKDLMQSREKVSVSGIGTVNDVGLQLSPKEATVSLGHNTLGQSSMTMTSVKGGANGVSARALTRKMRKKMKVVVPLSGSLSSEVSDMNEGLPCSGSSNHHAEASMSSDTGLRHEQAVTISSTRTADDLGSHPCPKEALVELENSAIEVLQEAIDTVRGEGTFISNGKCISKSDKKKVMSPSLGLLNSQASEIGEGPIVNGDSSAGKVGTALSSDKARTHLELQVPISGIGTVCDVGLHSLNEPGASCGNYAGEGFLEVKGSESCLTIIGSDGTCTPKIKWKRKAMAPLLSFPSSPAPEIHKIALYTNTSANGADVALSSGKGLKQPEHIEVSGNGIVCNVSLQNCQNGRNVPETRAVEAFCEPIVSAGGASSENISKLDQLNVGSSSVVEDLAAPSTQSPSSVLQGRQQEAPCVSMTNCKEHSCKDNFMDMESAKGSGEQTEVDKSDVNDMLSRKNSEDIAALHSQSREESSGVPLELQASDLDQKSPGRTIEGDGQYLLVKDELPFESNYLSLGAETPEVSTGNSTDVPMESLDNVNKVDTPESFPMDTESEMLNAKQLLSHVSNEKDIRGDHKLDEKSLIGGSPLSGNDSFASELELNVKPNKNVQSCNLITEKNVLLPSLETKKLTHSLKLKGVELNGKKSQQTSHVFPSRSSFVLGPLKEISYSTHLSRPRTWRRTDNPSTLDGKKSSPSTSTSQRQSPRKLGKVQGTSYIRKGNSLVRKCAPFAALPQASRSLNKVYRLNPVGKDETKNDTDSEFKVENVDPPNSFRTGTGRMNASLEIPKTPPLPQSTNIANCTMKSSRDCMSSALADPLSEDGSENILDLPKLAEREDTLQNTRASETQAGSSTNSGIQNIFNDGNSKSLSKSIIYVKRKSNQLVAAASPEHCDPSIHVAEKMQSLSSLISSDCYYKKKKNQLIRNATSSGSHAKLTVAAPEDSSNSEGQRVQKVSSSKCSRNLSKKTPYKVLQKTCKPSKFSLVWTLRGAQSPSEDTNAMQRQKVLPYIFPWKRTAYWRQFMHSSASIPNISSFSLICRKLLLSRKRDTVYTRCGFSLRKSKVLSIGGKNLKWSKSIEKHSKKANEEATLAVVAVDRKKREQKDAACVMSTAKNRNQSSRERIFRIGSMRYKMDPSRHTLQRIADEKSSAVDLQSGKKATKSFIPRRLVIGNDEYVRLGNGNQLVRDPKKLIRILASEKIRWSLHTARLRLARKQQYCQFFTRFGKCNKDNGKCPYIHDPSKIAVCTKFLKGLCSNTNCKLTHKVIPERMQDCSYFLQGLCTNENCPYRHVNVNPDASVCEGFLRGYCADGNECRKKHSYVCPAFEATGICPQRSMCKLHHPKNRNKGKKRKRSKDHQNTRGRYFGSRITDVSEPKPVASDLSSAQNSEDIFFLEGKFTDYISLDISDEEMKEISDPTDTQATSCESDPSELPLDDSDELIKPIRIMVKNRT
uniref:C3H1-type domain-containing protein n=1 Tax=Nelumbo nucifera TaxID=4432 RepID=A0A822Z421_NELNU|nr:TPA_asm: hypothetical protein HUJ06_014125 [Nelumbo nucifera]